VARGGEHTAGQILSVQVGAGLHQDPGYLHVPKHDGTVQRCLARDSIALLDVCTRSAQQLHARQSAAPAGLVDGRSENTRIIRALSRREQTLHLLIVAARCCTGELVEEQHASPRLTCKVVELRSAAGAKRFLFRGSGEKMTHLPNGRPPLTSLIAKVPCFATSVLCPFCGRFCK
jgi:hypothetical protein